MKSCIELFKKNIGYLTLLIFTVNAFSQSDKVNSAEYFGKLSQESRLLINKVLNDKYKIDTNKIVFIRYMQGKIVFKGKSNNPELMKVTKENELKYFGGKNKITSLYINNDISSKDLTNFKDIFFKDYNLHIKKVFNVLDAGTVIYYPSGDYYLLNNLSFRNIKLFKKRYFKRAKKRWNKKKDK